MKSIIVYKSYLNSEPDSHPQQWMKLAKDQFKLCGGNLRVAGAAKPRTSSWIVLKNQPDTYKRDPLNVPDTQTQRNTYEFMSYSLLRGSGMTWDRGLPELEK